VSALRNASATSILLDDVTIPPPGNGLFYVLANAGGKAHRIGEFSIFMEPMKEATKASVLVNVDPAAAARFSSLTTFTVIPAQRAGVRLAPFAIAPQARGTELKASAATLIVQ
jgi:hypothetical protein